MSDLRDRMDGIHYTTTKYNEIERLRALDKATKPLHVEIERLRAQLAELEKRMKEAPRLIVEDCSGELCLTNMDAIEMEIGVSYILLECRNDDPNES